MKTKVIVNPAARMGKSGTNWDQVEARLNDHIDDFDVVFTESPGHAGDLTRQALGEGFERFVPVGGDGTANEVMNGLCENGCLSNPEAVLAPIPAGTANEFCRNLGLLDDPLAPYRALQSGPIRKVDLQLIRCRGLDEGDLVHHAGLITSVGSAAEISYKTNHSRYIKKLGPEFCYYLVAILVTLGYLPRRLDVAIDDAPAESLLVHSGLICNMEYGGGGMRLAPGAAHDDGRFDFVVFGDIPRRVLLTRPPSWLFEGHHIEHPKVSIRQGRKIRISGDVDGYVDTDGETIGRLPLELEMNKQALNFLVAPV